MGLTVNDISKIYHLDLVDLIEEAHRVHRVSFKHNEIQASSLVSIKTGGCSENCTYCSQSAHHQTSVERHSLLSQDEVVAAARRCKEEGSTRLCMGAAWSRVRDGDDFEHVLKLISAVQSEGLEVCCSLGMLSLSQAVRLKEAGLHYYNHNIDTSEDYYPKVVQTRSYQDRLETIGNVREAGLRLCTGGILGLGESDEDRIKLIYQLASFVPQPESVTINTLVPIPGTPLENSTPFDALDVVRVAATLRITNPKSMIRLSAGRLGMSSEAQFLCFYVGANSIFLGDKLLTSPNPSSQSDHSMLKRGGFKLSESSIS